MFSVSGRNGNPHRPKRARGGDKVEAGVRLTFDDGMLLSTHPDVLTVGQIANVARERLHGNITYYNRNLHLNTTNVCEASCGFCSFARLKEGMPSAYTMTPEQAYDILVAEIHAPDFCQ